MKRILVHTLGVLAVMLLVVGTRSANADVIYNMTNVFSGTDTIGGSFNAVIADNGSGGVTLTMTSNLTSGEFISGWYFNVKDTFNPTLLSIVSGAGTNQTATVSKQEDGFKADGDGKYDILFSWSTANNDPNRFDNNDTAMYTIAGISAEDFNVLSTPAGGNGPFLSAAHLQGTGSNNGGSVWVSPGTTSVPEPGMMMLFGSGLLGLGLFGRKKFQK